MATVYAVARLFLFRVPSECLPLQRHGEHSRIELQDDEVCITLFRRKNCRKPSLIRRKCVCTNEGKLLCAVCRLKGWLSQPRVGNDIFRISPNTFQRYLRHDIGHAGISNPHLFGSHAFRRGMARDIVLAGGSLATLLLAGQWSSGAYRAYLQSQAIDEHAIAKLVIDHRLGALDLQHDH